MAWSRRSSSPTPRGRDRPKVGWGFPTPNPAEANHDREDDIDGNAAAMARRLPGRPGGLTAVGMPGYSQAQPVDAPRAREALKIALEHWKKGEDPKTLESSGTPMVAQDFEWTQGAKLMDYQVVNDGKEENDNLRVQVKLTLSNLGQGQGEARREEGLVRGRHQSFRDGLSRHHAAMSRTAARMARPRARGDDRTGVASEESRSERPAGDLEPRSDSDEGTSEGRMRLAGRGRSRRGRGRGRADLARPEAGAASGLEAAMEGGAGRPAARRAIPGVARLGCGAPDRAAGPADGWDEAADQGAGNPTGPRGRGGRRSTRSPSE